ncbi:lysozyme inhibitor LprI family protein [Stakelama saccharophila]|uniref:Lysozyme inhibitor LprI-like N-terminal domain-containing protein n=1 Tax=Stakelama saccharophila TaxID=3075605 RepID=A0ABZ0BDJ3_9SPHN|nr:lysozyme inhibitor LprI family protein [Stakelama sp. W311]WNO55225.1 hypothetical protein RPR59_00670 [Stakelama sp. W311]
MRWRMTMMAATAMTLAGCGGAPSGAGNEAATVANLATEPGENGMLPVRGAASASFAPDAAEAPAYDCAKASNSVERMICAHPDLAARDRALSAAYRTAVDQASGAAEARLRSEQRAFLTLRDACTDAACVAESYDARLDALRRPAAPNADARGGDDVAGQAALARRSEDSCLSTAGRKKAETLVKQCLAASPATHPPCNMANSCAMIEDEIERSCGLFDGDEAYFPDFCRAYRDGGGG